MSKLEHPLIAEIEILRTIILSSSKLLAERIKWNAPSYYHQEDLLTFNFHDKNMIRIIFHYPEIVNIQSGLLEGDYKDRRIMYLKDMAQIKKNKKEIQRIIKELIGLVVEK